MNNIDSIRSELDTLTNIIVATVPVEQIYLFGSYAYGMTTIERVVSTEGLKIYG
ncbi:MAG: hypothetical protein Ta2B_27640 [Termitinemataceae bacterium]|nr:MAG: hypothetical protein Ta2B_27640 [Termitinemataceae bacterium]